MYGKKLDTFTKTMNQWMKENDKYPVVDWQYEVQNNYTRLGYLEWVAHHEESERSDAYNGISEDARLPVYVIEGTEDQVRLIKEACDLYVRMHLGQIYKCIEDYAPINRRGQRYHDVLRDAVLKLAPILTHGNNGTRASFSIGDPALKHSARVVCDMYEVLRHELHKTGTKSNPLGSTSVDASKPMNWARQTLIQIKKKSEN